ncbi:MAG: DUF2809 domain-containing protein [Bacteroidetes bacterium]|nr:DUF2809 domain-containing protein [Bacteroidota bacterium]
MLQLFSGFGLHKQSKWYLLVTICLLFIEIAIALFVKDKIIRPYIGDLLVVILIYAFVKIWISNREILVAICVFVFACFIELLQYFHIVEVLGLDDNKVATVIIGSKFNTLDIVMYLMGTIVVILTEKFLKSGLLPWLTGEKCPFTINKCLIMLR